MKFEWLQNLGRRNWLSPRAYLSWGAWQALGVGLLNLLAFSVLVLYLLPMAYMLVTSFMESRQLSDRNAPAYPATQVSVAYEGKDYLVYNVPLPDGQIKQWALYKAGRTTSLFLDPSQLQAGTIEWQGNWRALKGVYRFAPTLANYDRLFRSLRFPRMVQNTLILALISEIGVLLSSTIVAYGFARFPLPGGNLLFYLLIATILIPEKVTLIPTYFFFVRVLKWNGSWLPLLLPFFFGSAVYIFLLRQNFKSIPREMDEAAMLDGAGPLRILFSVILPQSWPVVITVSILHFFYIWNETRQASLYLSIRPDLAPVSFGVQNYQTLLSGSSQSLLQASALLVMAVPMLLLLVSQRFFMQDMLITGLER